MPSPRYWREIPSRFRLEASKCKKCGKVSFPVRKICPGCRGTEYEKTRLSRAGMVVTATAVHVGPDDFAMQVPYAVAIVETPERARLMMQVVDCDPSSVVPGLKVAFEFRRIRKEGHGGILCYGHKAVPTS